MLSLLTSVFFVAYIDVPDNRLYTDRIYIPATSLQECTANKAAWELHLRAERTITTTVPTGHLTQAKGAAAPTPQMRERVITIPGQRILLSECVDLHNSLFVAPAR